MKQYNKGAENYTTAYSNLKAQEPKKEFKFDKEPRMTQALLGTLAAMMLWFVIYYTIDNGKLYTPFVASVITYIMALCSVSVYNRLKK